MATYSGNSLDKVSIWQKPTPAGGTVGGGYTPVSYSGGAATPGGGFPTAAPYQSSRDASGQLLAPYREGDSSVWQNFMNKKIQDDTSAGIDKAAASQAGANQQALSSLMMRGGASGGAGERIGSAGAVDMMKAQQAQRQLGQQNLYDVAQKGEIMDREARSKDIERALQDLGGVNDYQRFMLDQNIKMQQGYDANPNAGVQANSKWAGVDAQLAEIKNQIKDGAAGVAAPTEGTVKKAPNGTTYLYRNGRWILGGGQESDGSGAVYDPVYGWVKPDGVQLA